MKVIIAGGRDFNNYGFAEKVISAVLKNTNNEDLTIISGACSTGKVTYVRPDGTNVCGADGIGERYAADHNIKVCYYPADWETHGKAAGMIRNKQMADACEADVDGLIAFWDGESRGTENMIRLAGMKGMKIRMKRYVKA